MMNDHNWYQYSSAVEIFGPCMLSERVPWVRTDRTLPVPLQYWLFAFIDLNRIRAPSAQRTLYVPPQVLAMQNAEYEAMDCIAVIPQVT